MTDKISGHIVPGPEFFANDVKRYRDVSSAWVREMAQNSIDSGADEISVTVQPNPEGRGCIIKWSDNGCGMTLDIIQNALLVIGASNKQLGGVGGFGVAGCMLYFAMKFGYKIVTGGHLVEGLGGSYTIDRLPMRHEGTTSIVHCYSDVRGDWSVVEMNENIQDWFSLSRYNGSVTLNGQAIRTWDSSKVKKVIEHDWCKMSVMKPNGDVRNVVRINQQAMFEVSVPNAQKNSIFIDLTGEDSSKFVNQSRDSMTYPYSDKLNKWIAEISRDPRLVTKADAKMTVIAGKKGTMNPDLATQDGKEAFQAMLLADPEMMAQMLAKMSELRSEGKWDGHTMLINNSTSAPTPDRFKPGTMGKYETNLMEMWNHACMIVASCIGFKREFTTGWCFDLEDLAQHYSRYGIHYISLNPVNISKTGRMTNRYGTLSTDDFHAMVEMAIHEFTHAQGHHYHDEGFAAQMGENFRKVMKRWKTIESVRKDLGRARRAR